MESLLRDFVVIAILSSVVIFACLKIKIPPIVGFLISGVLFGPSCFGLVQNAHTVDILAEIGVVFLLFSIGMEISISELIRLRKPVFFGGTMQVLLTIGAFFLLAEWRGLSFGASVFAGFLMALSSTAIVLKTLQQNAQMESPAGRISLSILIYQDLVIVPMMLAIPLLAGAGGGDPWSLAATAGMSLGIIAAIFLLARKGVPLLLKKVVGTRSRELFLMGVLGICLGTAYLSAELKLSLSLGAFLAGLMVAESEYSHSALEGILPFRDVFTSVFFISVGMLLDVNFFFSHIGEVAAVTVLTLCIKALVAGGAAKLLGYPIRPAVITGLALCQIGEFSFVLAKSGLDFKLITDDQYQLFLAASILTMAATPFLINAAPHLAARMGNRRTAGGMSPEHDAEHEEAAPEVLADHLVVIGYGAGGKLLTRAAKMAGIRYVILEMNPDTVRHYAAEGEPIFHGDATHPAMLHHLGLHKARVLAIVISDPAAVRGITEVARHANPNVHILVRTRFMGEVAALKELGASDVIPEEFETAIEIFTRVLSRYLVPQGAIEKFIREVRAENYDMLRKIELPGTSIGALQKQMPDLRVSVFKLEQGAPLDGKTLQESSLRQEAKLTVAAVQRGEQIFQHPGGDFRLAPEDLVYVFSSADQAAEAELFFSA